MSKVRFDGRVAVVTGAGGGLGRAYSKLLASLGASVVVNDLGTSTSGSGKSAGAADVVVEEIKKSGGRAVANYDSVENGDRIVQTALDAFGRVDILINNAGILRDTSFQNMKDEDWDLVYEVHLRGAYRVTKAAWPHMVNNKYGRVIMTASAAGLYGNFGQANYGAAKMGLHGFSQALSKEGRKHQILVNTISPLAGSRMTEKVLPRQLLEALRPEYVAPFVAYLVSEENKTTGALYEVGAGYIARVRWQRSRGKLFPTDTELKAEAIRDAWREIGDFSKDPQYPTDMSDSSRIVMEYVSKRPASGSRVESSEKNVEKSASGSPSVEAILEMLRRQVERDGPMLKDRINGVFELQIVQPDGRIKSWTIDLKSDHPSLKEGAASKAEVQLTMKPDDFVALVSRRLNVQSAFVDGRLKVKGNLSLAMKFEPFINSVSKL
ncbi:peroxisomal multifunctional enzyme A-like [Schistocerca gregaria]|uniref:peroxisomal multifunctional enzyme A-like n=1 Tax=Schistocerca gregaria TaxID=7010 RepID=UPI00211DED5C|nr:peroxisomal multifunctional enzyme A-like [Schistocerca gregaria]